MKEVLVVYYSQTGQLFDIISNVISEWKQEEINLTYHKITPENPYDFPWKKSAFFDVFPETFKQVPSAMVQPTQEVLSKKYDLVILGYQVWYLSPSIPINSFLVSEAGKKLLKDTPVVTVIGCRNMWIQAHEKLKRLLVAAKAQLVGNIVLADRHINHISVITITHWMFTGRKDRMYGVFPKPGVSDKDISEAVKFGLPVKDAVISSDYSGLQEKLVMLGAVKIKPFLVLADKRANLLFAKWANLVIKKGGPGHPKRRRWLILFNYYLLFAIWVVAPIVFIVFLISYFPMIRKIRNEKKYFSSVSTEHI